MIDLLADLVRSPTTLGNEEPGQQVIEGAIRELGLIPFDVTMDPEQLRVVLDGLNRRSDPHDRT